MSTVIDLLIRIRIAWMQAASEALARGESLRHSVSAELSRFYDLLTESIATGDPSWMESFLQGWLNAQAVTEVVAPDGGQPPSLVPVLQALRQVMLDVAQANLEPAESLQLISQTELVFTHATEYLAREEVRLGMESVTSKMVEVQGALEQLDKSKSNFIAVAAHELKTPLTLIEGYSKMLEELLDREDPRGKTMLVGIANGARRLKEIIDDMIDVSMIDNNMLSLHFQPVWLNRLLALAEAEVTDSVLERRLIFEIKPFDGWDQITYADPERMLQAILNVIRNAIKYTPDGGLITIDGRQLPGFVELRIADSGIGIAPEDQSRIFEKFGRLGNPSLHSSGKTKFMGGGPGLGLPIAKGILEAHGGAIWVDSPGYDEEACPGSTFHLMVPLRQTAPDAKAARLFEAVEESNT